MPEEELDRDQEFDDELEREYDGINVDDPDEDDPDLMEVSASMRGTEEMCVYFD